MNNADSPHRQALQGCARTLADISYQVIEILSKFEQRLPKGMHFTVGEAITDVIVRLDRCAGELEGWKGSPWRDRGTLPSLRILMRKATVTFETLIQVVDDHGSDDLEPLISLSTQLEKDYKRLRSDLRRHLDCLMETGFDFSTLPMPMAAKPECYDSILEVLASA